MRMQPQPAEARVGLQDQLYSSWASVPKAEKTLLTEFAVPTIVGTFVNCCIPIFNPTTMVVFTAGFSLYRYLTEHKPKQDAAVRQYYQEVAPYGLREGGGNMRDYYDNSPVVKAMGGFKAIHNACATRMS